MKFKLGQKVKIKEWDKMAKEYSVDEDEDIMPPNGVAFVYTMRHLCGRTATITSITEDNDWTEVTLDFDNKQGDINWDYSTYMIEPIDFTKETLENGMILETREGDRFLYINGIATNPESWFNLEEFSDNLKFHCDKDLDIMKIFKLEYWVGNLVYILNHNTELQLIWEREEDQAKPKVKQISKADAIKILKEKFPDFDEVEIV